MIMNPVPALLNLFSENTMNRARVYNKLITLLRIYLFLYYFSDYVWLGGYDIYDNDTFYWLDGTAVEDGYTNFCHTDGRDDNGMILLPQCGTPDWGWGDWPEDDPHIFMCEKDLWNVA